MVICKSVCELTQAAKSCVSCSQLALTCIGWPNVKKTCINLATNLSTTKVSASHRKSMQVGGQIKHKSKTCIGL